MEDNVRKVFDILGVEPNERFKIERCGNPATIYTVDENLIILDDKENIYETLLAYLLRGDCKIIKLPKTKKLRDLTEEEYKKWKRQNCGNLSCEDCVFIKAKCNTNSIGCWVNHKDIYSDKFLNQEIEVEE